MKVMQGIVVSSKTPNTVTVMVERQWQHPLYKKYVKRNKKYACHVEAMTLAEGDVVVIQACSPMSKTKRYMVAKKIGTKVQFTTESEVATEVKSKVEKPETAKAEVTKAVEAPKKEKSVEKKTKKVSKK